MECSAKLELDSTFFGGDEGRLFKSDYSMSGRKGDVGGTAPAPESVKEENRIKLFLASYTLTTIWWFLSAAPETLTSLSLLSKQILLSIVVIIL